MSLDGLGLVVEWNVRTGFATLLLPKSFQRRLTNIYFPTLNRSASRIK
jgi:hypothetical protein